MLIRLWLSVSRCLQFAMVSALLTFSFLIQCQSIALHVNQYWLGIAIAISLVVSRVFATSYRYASLNSASWISVLGFFQIALLIMALFFSIEFFFNTLILFESGVLVVVVHIYHLPLTQTELLLILAVFLAVLLELALAVMLGYLARAYAPLLRAEQDYRLCRYQYLTQVENELRLTRATGQDLRDEVTSKRNGIERRLRQAVTDASVGKLAE